MHPEKSLRISKVLNVKGLCFNPFAVSVHNSERKVCRSYGTETANALKGSRVFFFLFSSESTENFFLRAKHDSGVSLHIPPPLCEVLSSVTKGSFLSLASWRDRNLRKISTRFISCGTKNEAETKSHSHFSLIPKR